MAHLVAATPSLVIMQVVRVLVLRVSVSNLILIKMQEYLVPLLVELVITSTNDQPMLYLVIIELVEIRNQGKAA